MLYFIFYSFQALKSYIKTVAQPSLAKFVIDHEEVVKTWIVYYDSLPDATSALKNKMKMAYKEVYPKKKKQPTLAVDLTLLFAEAKTYAVAMAEGNKTLAESTKTASHQLAAVLKEKRTDDSSHPHHLEPLGSPHPQPHQLEPLDLNSPQPHPHQLDSQTEQLTLSNGFNLSHAFNKFKTMASTKSQITGVRMNQDIHEILSLSHILLLTPNQHGPALIDCFGISNLDLYLDQLKKKYLDDVKMNDTLFLNIIGIVRTLQGKSRRTTKMELMKLACDVDIDDLDASILDVMLNCVQKLPDYQDSAPPGEQQLITNFIDPILSPLFHQPDHNRTFYWLNRTVEDTEILRPDGAMYITEQQHTKRAIGFCEVKAKDNEDNSNGVHLDLFRLSMFCKDTLDSGLIKTAMAVQTVDNTLIFYLFTLESAGLYVMFELGRMDAPLSYEQLTQFTMKLDFLKIISLTYRTHCVKRSKTDSIAGWKRSSLENTELKEMLNPGSCRNKKKKVALFFH
ncbi:hypothetical protein BC941DRAFT_383192 [Chlamydoabsidia padenii]|nr:hypothetical protein BC941DRAFT_383192 [Chlamydoabsidia padenii]